MRMLPLDVSRCANSECPLARTCLRQQTQTPNDAYRTVFTAFKGGEDCDSYIDMREG